MKQLRKVVVLAVFALVMMMSSSTTAKAERLNATSELVWGGAYNWEYTNAADSYHYTMNLKQSGLVTFTINAEKTDSSRIAVSDKSEVIWEGDVESGLNSYSVYLLAGSYQFEVYGDWGWADLKASMTPTFVPSGESVNENYMTKNNQLGTATSYKIGKKVKAQFAKNDDTDIYKVKVDKEGYLSVSFYNDITSMNMKITNTTGAVSYQEENIPIGSSKYKYLLPKGTYYISFTKDGYSGTYTFNTKLSGFTKTSVRSVKNYKGKKAKVTWNKKTTVDGYQVQVAQNKKFTKGKKTKTLKVERSYWGDEITSNPNNYTFSKLKSGKTYYARVRTYKMVGSKKVYSDWSKVKKVKIQK